MHLIDKGIWYVAYTLLTTEIDNEKMGGWLFTSSNLVNPLVGIARSCERNGQLPQQGSHDLISYLPPLYLFRIVIQDIMAG